MKIFSGTTNKDFAKRICLHLKQPLGNADINKFADGEIHVNIHENVRQENCFIIQSTCRNVDENISVNDSIMELLIMIDALKRGSAANVNVVIPYYGYSRQDRKDYSRAPISAAVVATCLESQNIDRVIVFDLHAGQIAGFFSNRCPLDNLYCEKYIMSYIKTRIIADNDNVVIIAPDEGAIKSAIRISTRLKCGTATIFKSRINPNEIHMMKLMGDVKGKIAVMVDDMIDTGGTMCKAADLLMENGAKEVYMLACHGLFSGNAMEKINNSCIKKIIVSNTVSHRDEVRNSDKIEIIDVSYLCSQAISRHNNGESLSHLYKFNADEFEPLSFDLL
jgi:ribose-phosphate pyrophosphokinase